MFSKEQANKLTLEKVISYLRTWNEEGRTHARPIRPIRKDDKVNSKPTVFKKPSSVSLTLRDELIHFSEFKYLSKHVTL